MNKTILEAKEYLSQGYQIDQRITSKLAHVSRLRDLATKVTNMLSFDPRPDTPEAHPMEAIIVKIVDLENEINAEIDALIEIKREIMLVIRQVKRPEYQTLLELRYHGFQTWEQIAETMYYSVQHVYCIHEKALGAVASILKL